MNWELLLPYLLGGGSAIYLLWEKVLRKWFPTQGEKAEDKQKEHEAASIGLDYIIKIDEYQTRKLSDVLKDIEDLKVEVKALKKENTELREENTRLKREDREKGKKLDAAYNRIQELQKVIIEKTDEVLQAKQELIKINNG